MKRLVLLILLGACGYLFYTNPDFDAHKSALAEQLPPRPLFAERTGEDNPFGRLDFSNFLFASTTKDTETLTMVSYGFAGRVKIIDTEWQPSK